MDFKRRQKKESSFTRKKKTPDFFYAVKHPATNVFYVDESRYQRNPYTMPRDVAVSLKKRLMHKFYGRFRIVKVDKYGQILRTN